MTPKQEKELQAVMTVAHRDFAKGLNVRAFFKIGDRSVGEDLVQDTFLKTWKYLVRGGKVEIMKAFLYHVLNHLIVDEYRKRKTTSLEVLLENGFEPRMEESDNFLNVLDSKAAIVLITRLPVKYQKIMKMRFVQDLSLKEMSILTGETKNSMAVQVHRGIEKLKLLYRPV